MTQQEAMPDDWTTPIPQQTGDGRELCIKMTKLLESKTMVFGGYYETFRTTIDVIYEAIAGNEAEYLKLVKNIKREALDVIAEISGMLIAQLCYNYVYDNYLGVIYESLSHNDKRMGQFFTPWPVAYMMAQMIMGDVKAQIEQTKKTGEKIKLIDPAVGSGVLLLAKKRVIIEQAGLQGLDYFEFYGQDIDNLCVKMCKIHMMLTDYRYMTNRLLLALYEVAGKKQITVTVPNKEQKAPAAKPADIIVHTGKLDDYFK